MFDRYNWSDPLYSPVAEMTAEDTEYYLRIAAIPLEQSIVGCHIFGVQTNCSEVFTVVKTDGGELILHFFGFNQIEMFKQR